MKRRKKYTMSKAALAQRKAASARPRIEGDMTAVKVSVVNNNWARWNFGTANRALNEFRKIKGGVKNV